VLACDREKRLSSQTDLSEVVNYTLPHAARKALVKTARNYWRGYWRAASIRYRRALSEIESELQQRLDPTRRRTVRDGVEILNLVPRIVCADGFSMSVQASADLSCSPQNDRGPYRAVEVGYLPESEPLLDPYSVKLATAIFVPIETIAEVIRCHGGFLVKPQSRTPNNLTRKEPPK
jgi:hypothetical protein